MNHHQLTMSEPQHKVLRSLLGTTLLSFSGDEMQASNFAWFWVDVTTTTTSVRLSNKLASLTLSGHQNDYTSFEVTESDGPSRRSRDRGYVYFQGKGQTIHEIWIIQEAIRAIKDAQPLFDFHTDHAIAFKLDNMWVAISKDSVGSEAIHIQHAASRESLSLPALDDEWPSDLLERYDIERTWIQL